MSDIQWILDDLESMADPDYIQRMEYFGIKGAPRSLGIKHAVLKPYAKEIGKNQEVAEQLWEEPIHEAKHLAIWLSEPKKLVEPVAEKWTSDCYSWDLVDGIGMKVIPRTSYAWKKINEWSRREPEFEKRMSFATMVGVTLFEKKTPDEKIAKFLPIIEKEAWDDRNFVKKAVSWALRQIGKRSFYLNEMAIEAGERVYAQDSKAAKWIASDALRELRSEKVQIRLRKKS